MKYFAIKRMGSSVLDLYLESKVTGEIYILDLTGHSPEFSLKDELAGAFKHQQWCRKLERDGIITVACGVVVWNCEYA